MITALIIERAGRYIVRKLVDGADGLDNFDLSFAQMLHTVRGCHPIQYPRLPIWRPRKIPPSATDDYSGEPNVD